MRHPWELRLVGECLLVAPDGRESDLSAKSKRFAVLVYLAVPSPGQWVRRDVLMATFWPELDDDRARNALRVMLYQLRRLLGGDAIRALGDEQLALNPSSVRVDLGEVLEALETGEPMPWLMRSSLELVPGLHVPDADPFHEWLDAQRLALKARIGAAAWRVVEDATVKGDLPRAITAARAATRLNREDEAGVRRLIGLLDRAGDRASALAEFEQFRRWLGEEIGVPPAPETLALVQRVRARTVASDPPDQRLPGTGEARAVLAGGMPGAISGTAPPRRRHGRWAGTAAVLVGAAALAVWHYASPTAGPDYPMPVAVLALSNDIRDGGLAWLTRALAESITDELSPTEALPFEATRRLTGADGLASVRAMGAGTIVTGSVGGTSDALELRLTIASVGKGRRARSLALRGTGHDLTAFRDTVGAEIRRFAGLTPRMARAHVPDEAAYRIARDAAWLLSRRSATELLRARDLYNRALELDPDWHELWVGLARANGMLATRNLIDARTGFLAAEHEANEALSRQPSDGRALTERAAARFFLGDRLGAEADARRASELDSTDFHMQSLLGMWWRWRGGPLDSALAYKRRAQRLAPWDRQTAINIAEITECTDDSAATVRAARRALDLDPNAPAPLETLAWALTRFGRWDEAAATYQRIYPALVQRGVSEPADQLTGEARFRALVRLLRAAAHAEMVLHPPEHPPPLSSRIRLFEDLGMRDSSLVALSSVVDSLDAHRAYTLCGPALQGLRRDPRALAIVESRGWPLAEFGQRH